MHTTSKFSLLRVNFEDIIIERNLANLDEEKISEGVDAIRKWMKKEDHLADAEAHINYDIIERFLVLTKGSLESCKSMIDQILTTRALMPDIALNRTYEEFDGVLDNMVAHPLPNPNPLDRTRVYIIGFTNENYQGFDFLSLMRFLFLFGEFRINFDYFYADRYILDLKNFKASMLTKLNPVILKKAEILLTKTYGIKMKGVHFINAPPYVDKIIFLLKQIFKEKLAQRIHVHKSYDELYKDISKDILPADYGGNAPSCKKLVEQWRDYCKTAEAKTILDNGNKLFSNESKRTNVQFNEEYLGIPGSFKKLNVD